MSPCSSRQRRQPLPRLAVQVPPLALRPQLADPLAPAAAHRAISSRRASSAAMFTVQNGTIRPPLFAADSSK